jgi:hypothetical protein
VEEIVEEIEDFLFFLKYKLYIFNIIVKYNNKLYLKKYLCRFKNSGRNSGRN